MQLFLILTTVLVLCFAFQESKEKENTPYSGRTENRNSYSYSFIVKSPVSDNASSIVSSSSSSIPFPTASLLTFQLHQSPGMAIDARKARQRRLFAEEYNNTKQTPLFQGMGVHYSYLWVGTPPQRISVIIDTGSHNTAFPCVGCKCGKHMNPFFNPAKSSSAFIKECLGKKCFYTQSYSEGSSWNAFKVTDQLWVGGPSKDKQPFDAARLNVSFDFGCLEHETGLFRTQNIDGIMGMYAAPDTLPYKLQEQGLTQSKVFALCFKVGGGVLTLGGVDPALHRPSGGAIRQQTVKQGNLTYETVDLGLAKLLRSRGWFTVRLLDVRMRAQGARPQSEGDGQVNASSFSRSIGASMELYNTGKGAILDSGSTDIYLPRVVADKFKSLYRELSGMQFHNNEVSLTRGQLSRLPVIIFRLEAAGSGGGGRKAGPDLQSFIDVECPPSSYMEAISGKKKYANSIFLTEVKGAVLGSSFIKGFNVIFDVDRFQLGLTKADCSYDDAKNRPPVADVDRNGTNPNRNATRGSIVRKKKKKSNNFIFTIGSR